MLAPRRSVESEAVTDSANGGIVDLGLIEQNEAKHTFRIRNPLDSAVSVTAVDTSCTCAHVSVKEGDIIPPRSEISVTMRTKMTRPGPIRVTAQIWTDAIETPCQLYQLSFACKFAGDVVVTPAQIQMSSEDTSALRVSFRKPHLISRFTDIQSMAGHVRASIANMGNDHILFSVKASTELKLSTDVLLITYDDPHIPTTVVPVFVSASP